MKLLLENSREISFTSKEDLSKAIPAGMIGKPLNYGQGEGQVEIAGAVWGFYVNSDGSYYMTFEEGLIKWEKFPELVNAIVKALNQHFNKSITVIAEGQFANEPNV